MSCYEKVVSRLDLWNTVLYTVVCGICFAEPDRVHSFVRLLWSIQRRNPPCNAEDNLCAGHIVIEAWFRGYCGSPGLGGPRRPGYVTWAGLMGREDTR